MVMNWIGGVFGGGDDNEPTYDPNDPSTWSGEERAQFLGAAGFRWISGEGDNAIWQAPDGRRVVEQNAFDLLLGYSDEAGKYQPPAAPKPLAEPSLKQSAPDTFVDAQGNGWRWSPAVNDYVLDYRFDDPRKAVGYVAPRAPAAGPSALDIAKEERADRESRAEIQRGIDAGAREDAKLRILGEQHRDAIDRGNRQEARDIATRLEDVQYRRDQAYARVEELNTAAMNRAAEFNASASESAAARQEQARATTLSAQRQNAADIASFQQMPGDVGALGAYLAARQGEGGSDISTAIGRGENFITDRSLAPLGTMLDTRAELSRPAMFSAARYDPAILAQPQQAPLIQRQAPTAPPVTPTPAATGFSDVPGGLISLDMATGKWMQGGQEVNPFDASGNLSLASLGGAPTAAPTPNGMPQQAPVAAPETAQPLIQRQAAYQPMTVTYGAPTQPNPGARMFQRQAAAESRTRSGLTGDLTPIRFSDPGTDPYLAELAGSVTAAEKGVDRSLFERERKRLAPRRLPVYGRTR